MIGRGHMVPILAMVCEADGARMRGEIFLAALTPEVIAEHAEAQRKGQWWKWWRDDAASFAALGDGPYWASSHHTGLVA